jgi:hypothetical protein
MSEVDGASRQRTQRRNDGGALGDQAKDPFDRGRPGGRDHGVQERLRLEPDMGPRRTDQDGLPRV